jgi:hypothetical protein
VGQTVLVPSHAYTPLPHGVPAGFGEKVQPPVASQPVHVFWQVPEAGEQLPAQQLPLAPLPVAAPQVKPEAHSRQSATLHVDVVLPAVVLHGLPTAMRATQLPAPLQ